MVDQTRETDTAWPTPVTRRRADWRFTRRLAGVVAALAMIASVLGIGLASPAGAQSTDLEVCTGDDPLCTQDVPMDYLVRDCTITIVSSAFDVPADPVVAPVDSSGNQTASWAGTYSYPGGGSGTWTLDMTVTPTSAGSQLISFPDPFYSGASGGLSAVWLTTGVGSFDVPSATLSIANPTNALTSQVGFFGFIGHRDEYYGPGSPFVSGGGSGGVGAGVFGEKHLNAFKSLIITCHGQIV